MSDRTTSWRIRPRPILGTLRYSDATPAEQLTLPTYPVVAIVAGLLYVVQPESRLSGPAFEYAKWLWPMDTWGWIFVAVGLCQLTALALGAYEGSRWVYVQTLRAGVFLTGFWAFLLFRSAQESPLISYTGAVWLGALVVLQIATTRGLTQGAPRA